MDLESLISEAAAAGVGSTNDGLTKSTCMESTMATVKDTADSASRLDVIEDDKPASIGLESV